MGELKPLTDAALERAYDGVFRDSFPPDELKPLGAMRDLIALGEYRALALCEDGRELGYACLWVDEPYVLFDYLCVPCALRGGGIGAEIIARIVASFPEDTVIIGEAEAPTGNAGADGIILRRLDFYRRSGAVILGYDTALFGVHYKTLVWSDSSPDESEVMRRHALFYRRRYPDRLYAAAVRIPLPAGESADVTADWENWDKEGHSMSETMKFADREEFHEWLRENCLSDDGIWLLFGKAGGPKTIKAGEALEEALCFGWIDGQIEKIDDKSYKKYFSQRRENSKWSEKNKALVGKLEERGLMTDFGRKKIDEAKKNGQWDAPNPLAIITEEQIASISALLEEYEPAYTNFQAMSPSVKKTYTRAYLDAKTDAGREKRIAWMVDRLNKNLKPM